MDDYEVEYRPLQINGEIVPGYRVGNNGSVWGCKNRHGKITCVWREMKLTKLIGGYFRVIVCHNKKEIGLLVSRLILQTFVGPCPEGMEANHKNDDPSDNNILNLKWDTPKNNISQRDLRGRQARGSRGGTAKLTEDDIPKILRLYSEGYKLREIGEKFGVHLSMISLIINGKNWKHMHDSSKLDHNTHSRDNKK